MLTYRHSTASGQHEFFPGVVGDPDWNAGTNELTVQFEGGETRTFGPNPEGEPIAYGRLLYRDTSTYIDEETGAERPAWPDVYPDEIVFNCTFWPVVAPEEGE